MGEIYGRLYQISQAEVERLRVEAEDVIPSILARKTARPIATEARSQRSMFDPPVLPVPTLWFADLDDWWDSLQWVLGADEPADGPLALALFDGEPVDHPLEDFFRIRSRAEVRAVASALGSLDRVELRRKTDAMIAATNRFTRDERHDRPDEFFGELMPYFERLAAIYRDASRSDNALLIEIGWEGPSGRPGSFE